MKQCLYYSVALLCILYAEQVDSVNRAIGTVPGVAEKNLDQVKIDYEAKRKIAIALVSRAVDYFKTHTLEQACTAFSHTKEFVDGEKYVFLFDTQGYCLAHMEEDFIWQNLLSLKDDFGTPFIEAIIAKAEAGGGWVTYEWRNTTKISYVQKVIKDGKGYVVGTGYYPHSKEDAVISLVKGAVAHFDKVKKQGQPPTEAFSDFSYPLGKFILADLYLYAIEFKKGTLMSQGDRPQLIGTDARDVKDSTGKLVNQEIIAKLKASEDGIWVDYSSKRALKKAYAEKVSDADGNQYAIVCGYYPETTRNSVRDLVKKGYTYLKQNGITAAVEAFSDKRDDEYRYGEVYLIVYDMNGKVIAHGANPELIGINQYDIKDEDERLYVQELVKEAKQTSDGWVTFKKNRSFQSMYFERIEMGIERFIITAGLYPISKKETVDLLVKTGASYLLNRELKEAACEFVRKKGKFINGDLELFVFDDLGLCYAYGDQQELIWRNLLNLKDDDGKFFVKLFINSVNQGPTKVTYKLNGRSKIAQLESIKKGDKRYVIGAAYYA